MRRSRRWGAALAVLSTAPAAGAGPDEPLTYAIIGDTPYGPPPLTNFPDDVAEINAELERLNVRGIQPDAKEARRWYERARQLGATDTNKRLERLGAH